MNSTNSNLLSSLLYNQNDLNRENCSRKKSKTQMQFCKYKNMKFGMINPDVIEKYLKMKNSQRRGKFSFKDFNDNELSFKRSFESKVRQQNQKSKNSSKKTKKQKMEQHYKIKDKQQIQQKLFNSSSDSISEILKDHTNSFSMEEYECNDQRRNLKQRRQISDNQESKERKLSRSFRKKSRRVYFQNQSFEKRGNKKRNENKQTKQYYDQFGFDNDPVLLQFLHKNKSEDPNILLYGIETSRQERNTPCKIYSSITLQFPQKCQKYNNYDKIQEKSLKNAATTNNTSHQNCYSKSLFNNTQIIIARSKSTSLLSRVKLLFGIQQESQQNRRLKRSQSSGEKLSAKKEQDSKDKQKGGLLLRMKGFLEKFTHKSENDDKEKSQINK